MAAPRPARVGDRVRASTTATAISERAMRRESTHHGPCASTRSIARRSPLLAAAWSQLGLGLLVRGVGRGGALLDVEGLVGLVDACAIVSRDRSTTSKVGGAQLIVSGGRSPSKECGLPSRVTFHAVPPSVARLECITCLIPPGMKTSARTWLGLGLGSGLGLEKGGQG